MSIYDEAGPPFPGSKISSASINYMTDTWVLRATLTTVRKTWEKEYKLNIIEEEEDEEAARRRRRPHFLDKYLRKP
jgi:hypothetical protein